MENKYYTPEIQEFYTGFKYEEEVKNPNYNKMSKPLIDNYEFIIKRFNIATSISKITSLIESKKVRVKYLNKQDIESLGFVSKSNKVIYEVFEKQETELCYSNENLCTFNMIYDYMSNRLSIRYIHDKNEEHTLIFSGTIKNKSELQVLLKQLGI